MAQRSNLPPGAFAEKDALGGIPNVAIPFTVPAFVASSLGSGAVTLGETVSSHVASGFDALANAATGTDLLLTVDLVTDRTDGVANYFEGTHFQLTNDMLDWTIRPTLVSPALDTPIITNSGTGLASGDYYYVVTVRNNTTGESNWTSGQAFASGQVGPSAASGTVKVGWEAINNALDYHVYRTQTADSQGRPVFTGQDGGLLVTVNGATQYTDDATDSLVTATVPPSGNTAFDEPEPTTSYTVDYTYKKFLFNTPKKYRTVDDVITDHGFGSQAAIMAEFAMSNVPGRGNSAAAVWITAAGDAASPTDPPGRSDYQTALTGFSNITDDHLIVVLGANSDNLRQQLKQYVETESSLSEKRERIGITFPDNGTAIGSSGDTTTILGQATQLASKRITHVATDSGSMDADIQDVATRTRVRGTANPEYIAAMVAGRLSSLPDTAEPLTRKSIIGPRRFIGTREYNPKELLDLRDGGVCVVDYKGDSNWVVFQGVTTNTANQDDAELSVVLASDTIAFAWRDAIDPKQGAEASLIGSKLTPGILSAVKQRTIRVLDTLANQGIIFGYDINSIVVAVDPDVTTRINVTFQYQPIFPVNSVVLVFSSSFTLSG